MEMHNGQNQDCRSLLINEIDHSIGEAVNKDAPNLMIQNGPQEWVGSDSLNGRKYFERELIAKSWFVALIVVNRTIKLFLGTRMKGGSPSVQSPPDLAKNLITSHRLDGASP